MSKVRRRPGARGRASSPRRLSPLYIVLPIVFLAAAAVLWALAAAGESDTAVKEEDTLVFPAWLEAMSPLTKFAYTQTVAHWEELEYIPCFCGCSGAGHDSVADCHVRGLAADGSIVYDQHAAA